MLELNNTTSEPEYTRANVGHFEIAGHFFETDTHLEALRQLFADLIIIRCEHLFHGDRFGKVMRYTAISKHFVPIEKGMEIPTYSPTITEQDGIPIAIDWNCDTVSKVVKRMTEKGKTPSWVKSSSASLGQEFGQEFAETIAKAATEATTKAFSNG
jgi:hypothetical protein